MDEFEFEHGELTGSLISMEFGQGGRIQQLWVAESATPEGTQEFQFVSPALDMGEEVTEDYFPGTILLGARMAPEDPWIVGKNATATRSDNSEIGPTQVTFEYQFAFLDEISATGKFYEIPGPIPQIAWDLEIRNRARKSIRSQVHRRSGQLYLLPAAERQAAWTVDLPRRGHDLGVLQSRGRLAHHSASVGGHTHRLRPQPGHHGAREMA
jgi:hypothetical protein